MSVCDLKGHGQGKVDLKAKNVSFDSVPFTKGSL